MKCDELDQFLTDHLEGDLDEARQQELAAHLETCAACRAELESYRQLDQRLEQYYKIQLDSALEGQEMPEGLAPVKALPRPHARRWAALAVAALAFVALGVWAASVYRQTVPRGQAALAQVQKVQGHVLAYEGDRFKEIGEGAALRQDQLVKVATGGYLALRLKEGNIVEARGGTQLRLNDFPNRLEVKVHRGHIWAHLNTHPPKPFAIQTAHLTATAKGTVYGVEEGLDRSVVTVAQGTVAVASGQTTVDVSAGEVFSSREGGTALSAAESASWSQYPEDMAALTQTAAAPAPTLAVETFATPAPTPAPADAAPAIGDLTQALPDNTHTFVSLKDWQGIMTEFGATDYLALLREPSVQLWWQTIRGRSIMTEFIQNAHLLEIIGIAKMIDGQIVVAFVAPKGDFLLIADCGARAQEIQAQLDAALVAAATAVGAAAPDPVKLAELRDRVQIARGRLVIASDPARASEAIGRIVSGQPSGFAAGDFYKKVAANVQNPRFVLAVNLAGIDQTATYRDSAEARRTLDFLGAPGLDYLVVSPNLNGRGINQAARLGFEGERFGLMNWLGEPAPMRGFDFFSPDVHFFASAILRAPRQMVFDYLLLLQAAGREEDQRSVRGWFERHTAFFDALGSEVAMGIDNPILPVPNIKVSIEVVDRPAAELALDQIVGEAIEWLDTVKGRFSYREVTVHKGQSIHRLVIDGVPIEPSYAFVDDYLILGPGPQFVRDSIDVHEARQSIGGDTHLLTLLPGQAETNFSLLVYQDVAKTVPELLRSAIAAKLAADEQQYVPDLSFMERYRAPGIAYAYARPSYADLYLNAPNGIDLNAGMAVPLVARWLLPRTDIGQRLEKYAQAVASLETLKAAALRFQVDTGRLPASMAELAEPAGRYLDAVPADPFGNPAGAPLKLAPGAQPGEIILYSVGPDGVDEQGRVLYDVDNNIDGGGDIIQKLPEPPPQPAGTPAAPDPTATPSAAAN